MTIHFEPGARFGGHPGAAQPRVEAPTTTPGEPETRENNGNTERDTHARHKLRRRIGIVASMLAVATGVGVWGSVSAMNSHKEIVTTTTPGSEGLAGGMQPTPDRVVLPRGERTATPGDTAFFPQVFPETSVNDAEAGQLKTRELTLDNVFRAGLPPLESYTVSSDIETKDREARLAEAREALQPIGQVIRYAVNKGGPEGRELLDKVFPDSYDMGTMNANELLSLMAFIEHNRATPEKSGYLPDYYAWGMNIQPVRHEHIGIPDDGSVWVVAKAAWGDYRPYGDSVQFQPPKEELLAFKMTSRAHRMGSNKLNEDGIWAIADVRPATKKGGSYEVVFDSREHSAFWPLPEAYTDAGKTPLERYDLKPVY